MLSRVGVSTITDDVYLRSPFYRHVILLDHYEFLEEVLGPQRLYSWEMHHSDTLFKPAEERQTPPKLVVAYDEAYLERRYKEGLTPGLSHVGLLDGSKTLFLREPQDAASLDSIRDGTVSHLLQREKTLAFFFPDSLKLQETRELLRKYK